MLAAVLDHSLAGRNTPTFAAIGDVEGTQRVTFTGATNIASKEWNWTRAQDLAGKNDDHMREEYAQLAGGDWLYMGHCQVHRVETKE